MESVLLVIHLIVALSLICVVLAQRSAQDGGGLTGGSSTMGGLFTARGSANLLTRTTAILATIFMCTSLILGMLASGHHKSRSMTDSIAPIAPVSSEVKPEGTLAPAAEKPIEAPSKPAAPQVPVSK